MDKHTDRQRTMILQDPPKDRGRKNQIWNKKRLSLREKNNLKLNPFIKTMVHRSNIHYSRINQKRN